MFETHIDFEKMDQAAVLLPTLQGKVEQEDNLFKFELMEDLEKFMRALYE